MGLQESAAGVGVGVGVGETGGEGWVGGVDEPPQRTDAASAAAATRRPAARLNDLDLDIESTPVRLVASVAAPSTLAPSASVGTGVTAVKARHDV